MDCAIVVSHRSPSSSHCFSLMQVCKCEDFLQLGEEDVREMLRDEEVTPHCCCYHHE